MKKVTRELIGLCFALLIAQTGFSQTITDTCTSGYVPYATGTNSFGNSNIFNGLYGFVGINTNTPGDLLHIVNPNNDYGGITLQGDDGQFTWKNSAGVYTNAILGSAYSSLSFYGNEGKDQYLFYAYASNEPIFIISGAGNELDISCGVADASSSTTFVNSAPLNFKSQYWSSGSRLFNSTPIQEIAADVSGNHYLSIGSALNIYNNSKVGIGTTSPAHALDVNGDISSNGNTSTSTLNILGNSFNVTGLVADTTADTVAAPFIMEMDKLGNVKPFSRKLISTALFPSHKPHSGPCSGISVPSMWSYDSSFTGGAGILYTTPCQDVGVGTQTPDAAFTVSNSRYSYQISVLDTTTHTDLFTVDNSGNTTIQGTAFINGNAGIGASVSSITPLWVQSDTLHYASLIVTTPNGTSAHTPYGIMANVDYSKDSIMKALAVHNSDYGGNHGPFDAFFVQANGLIYTNGGLFIHNPKSGHTEFTVDTLGNTFIPTGKMAIGVAANDMPGNYKLYVKGGILTEHCRVGKDSTADWSDYVFAKDYKLAKLDSVEEYIKQNHHLKDIPTTDDVTKNGIDVAQMDAQLLKKVEELTLYVIQLQKDNDALKKEVEALKK